MSGFIELLFLHFYRNTSWKFNFQFDLHIFIHGWQMAQELSVWEFQESSGPGPLLKT